MKRLIVLTLLVFLVCPQAHAGWFSRKKAPKTAAEVPAGDMSANNQDTGRSSPVAVGDEVVDWSALQDAQEVMDAMVPRFNANKISSIHPGMSHAQVKDILGDSALVGYQEISVKDGTYESILLKNPYRVEILQGLGKAYEVFFYITDVKSSDGTISDDELTPVIFENDEMIGKDWNFYDKLKKQLNHNEFLGDDG